MGAALDNGNDNPPDEHTDQAIEIQGHEIKTSAQATGIECDPEKQSAFIYPFCLAGV